MGINRLDEATRFFENLYGKKKVRLATASMMDRGRNTQRFSESPMRLRLGGMLAKGRLDHMIRKSAEEDIFYAPTPMADATGRKKEQAQPSAIVFGDADHGLSPIAHARLIELGACLVQSGGITSDNKKKYHVYLRLKREIPSNELERLNRALKTLIDGDKWDCTTLLRIPGTINHKYPSKPMVIIERLASSFHDPDDLAKFLDVPDDDTHSAGVARPNTTDNLPKIPDGFNPLRGDYRMKKVLREWNGRFQANNAPHRYAAAVALVKEAIKHDLGIDVAYAYASVCEPLVDKSESEDGYDIQRDIYRTWHREVARTAPASTQAKKADPTAKPTSTPTSTPTDDSNDSVVEEVVPKMFEHTGEGPNPYSSRDSRKYLDMAIFTSGDFKIPEPELFDVDGSFFILYKGMTHCIFGDSGSGKTWMVLAFVAAELKAGRRVKYIDFENGAHTIGNRLRNVLGVPAELLTPEHFKYMWFNDKPEASEIDEEAEEAHDLVIIDGVDASLALWDTDPHKATEIRAWYNSFPQRFADEGSTVLSIDHTTKKSSKEVAPKDQQPGGAGTKLAVLTGAAFYVHPKDGYELVPGRRGIVEAYVTRKDKDGFLKSKATRESGHLFDFIIDTAPDGQVVIAFEAAKMDDEAVKRSDPQASLTDRQKQIMALVNAKPGIMTKSIISAPPAKGGLGGNKQAVNADVDWLVANHYLTMEGYKLHPTDSTTPKPVRVPGEATVLDFSRAGKDKTMGRHRRECAACGDPKLYPQEFVQPDEIGYDPKRALCSVCADDPIARRTPAVDTLVHRDGPGWAQSIRERMEKGNMHSDPDDL